MEALRVEKLSKDFGGLHALKNVSFSVTAGERLALIGPNGAGKTTLFNMLTGQLSPTTGRVYFFGQDITHLPIHKRVHLGLARSFQITNLFPNLTVLDNALLALQGTKYHRYQMFRPISAYQNMYGRAKELLEPWGLWEKREELARNIAYGDQRALEIVLTLASKPKVLLLDEPSSGLTAAQSTEIVGRIRELGTDVTVLFVAHDMDLVFGVADRICVLHYGEVIVEGSCEEIRVDAKVKEIYMGTGEMTHDTRAS